MASWVTRVRSYYTLNHGDPIRALRTAEASRQAPGHLSPAAQSIASHAAAMAAAAVGERDRSRQLAEEAYELALQSPAPEERPGWLYWLDPVRAKLLLGEAAHAARDWSVAVDALSSGLSALEGFPRDRAFYESRLDDARSRA